MTTLEVLYYGNISAYERYIMRGTRVDKVVKLICKNEEELNSGLTEKQKETFEKFKDCTSELSCITERGVQFGIYPRNTHNGGSDAKAWRRSRIYEENNNV